MGVNVWIAVWDNFGDTQMEVFSSYENYKNWVDSPYSVEEHEMLEREIDLAITLGLNA